MVVVVGFVGVSRIGCYCWDYVVVVVTPLRFIMAPIKASNPTEVTIVAVKGFDLNLVL